MATYAQSYTSEIDSLNRSITQRNEELRKLREQRRMAKKNLLEIMTSYGIETSGKYKRVVLDKEFNKQPYKRKPEREKRKDGIRLLKDAGVPDPRGFYSQFISTQKMQK